MRQAGKRIDKFGDPRSLAGRPQGAAELLGQVFTPPSIARRMIQTLLAQRNSATITLLDPCVGPSTFPRALNDTDHLGIGTHLTLVDVDPLMAQGAREWADRCEIPCAILNSDYLRTEFSEPFDYVIMNPPYVRQEWIADKQSYIDLFKTRYNIRIPGTANLYVYFVVKAIMDLQKGGRFAFIVYDSWQSTAYGRWLTSFMTTVCEAITVENLRNQPFSDRLIDATIIYGRKSAMMDGRPTALNKGLYQEDASHNQLDVVPQFSPIGAHYATQRGLRLKQADFFLGSSADIERVGATPFVKKVSKITGYAVSQDHDEAALLVTPGQTLPPALSSELQARLQQALEDEANNVSILTWHRERPSSWFTHRKPPYAPIIFNYYLRHRPRHIYNATRPYSDNFYGATVPDGLSPFACIAALNSTATSLGILCNARTQGAGLAKVQLYEYRAALTPDLRVCNERERLDFHCLGMDLIEQPRLAQATIERIDALVAHIFSHPSLKPAILYNTYDEVRTQKQGGKHGR